MEPTLRAERFAVLTATAQCHACQRPTQVSALLVPAYEEFDGETWKICDDSALLIYVMWVDDRAQQIWQQRSPWMRPVASATAGITYLANVCECGALQGDYFLTKPQAPFFPLDEPGLRAIDVEWIAAPIEADAELCISSWVDRLIDLRPYAGWVPRVQRKTGRARHNR